SLFPRGFLHSALKLIHSSAKGNDALNPLAKGDADLLTAIADPKWMINDLRNRDLVAALYHTETADVQERRRRSAQVTRQLRLLRAHGLLEKIEGHAHQAKRLALLQPS